jgi:hypothetical protein
MSTRLLILFVISLTIGCGHHPKSSLQRPEASVRQTARYTLRKNFRLFQSAPETLPRSVRSRISRLLKEPGISFKPLLVQRARTTIGVGWAFLDRNRVCLVQTSVGGACVAVGAAKSEGVSLGTFSPPSVHVPRLHDFALIGLASDEISGVNISVGHRFRTIGVHNNLYSASGDKPMFIRNFIRRSS